MENIHVNIAAVIVSTIANFILGFIWYTPLFGKRWGKEHGYDMTQKPPTSALMKGMAFMVIGNFLMAWVFASNISAWAVATATGTMSMSLTATAINAGFFTWLGFFFPVDLGRVAWERKSWTLFFIDTGYHLLSLILVAFILVYMH
jgi:hypothetical protein